MKIIDINAFNVLSEDINNKIGGAKNNIMINPDNKDLLQLITKKLRKTSLDNPTLEYIRNYIEKISLKEKEEICHEININRIRHQITQYVHYRNINKIDDKVEVQHWFKHVLKRTAEKDACFKILICGHRMNEMNDRSRNTYAKNIKSGLEKILRSLAA